MDIEGVYILYYCVIQVFSLFFFWAVVRMSVLIISNIFQNQNVTLLNVLFRPERVISCGFVPAAKCLYKVFQCVFMGLGYVIVTLNHKRAEEPFCPLIALAQVCAVCHFWPLHVWVLKHLEGRPSVLVIIRGSRGAKRKMWHVYLPSVLTSCNYLVNYTS